MMGVSAVLWVKDSWLLNCGHAHNFMAIFFFYSKLDQIGHNGH